jgi:hypothetical protein
MAARKEPRSGGANGPSASASASALPGRRSEFSPRHAGRGKQAAMLHTHALMRQNHTALHSTAQGRYIRRFDNPQKAEVHDGKHCNSSPYPRYSRAACRASSELKLHASTLST